jgi:proline racemase
MRLTRMVNTIDSHTAGEGTRLVVSGLPAIRGRTMLEKMAYAQQHLSWLPGWLLREPRGHKDLFGAVLVPPCHPEADAGVLFMDNVRYEPACGHSTIGVAASLLATGSIPIIEPETRLRLDTPAGLVETCVRIDRGAVEAISFDHVPAFVFRRDVPVRLEDVGELVVDVVFGGNFFVLVDVIANGLNLALVPTEAAYLARLGMRILAAVNEVVAVRHPDLPDLDRIIDLRFYASSADGDKCSRNVVILGDHMVDRSPCGTGTCAEMALRYARGELGPGQEFVAESILGTRFSGQVIEETVVGRDEETYSAVRPRVTGNAHITGFCQFVLHVGDPFPEGFLITA